MSHDKKRHDVLLDQRIFVLDPDQYDSFVKALDNPPPAGPKLKALMSVIDRCRAWHKPGEAITGDVQLYLDAANEIERLRAENDDLKAALDVWNSSELGLMITKLRADYAGKVRAYSQASDEVERLLEVNEQLRATLEWLRSYVSGHTVYGLPHALEKIDAALNEETK